MRKSSKYHGKWTSDRSDLVLRVINVRHIYDNGVVIVKYKLYNKRNGIVYEVGTTKLRPEFFKENYKVSIYD